MIHLINSPFSAKIVYFYIFLLQSLFPNSMHTERMMESIIALCHKTGENRHVQAGVSWI